MATVTIYFCRKCQRGFSKRKGPGGTQYCTKHASIGIAEHSLKKGRDWVRKSDGTSVKIDRVTKVGITFHTRPMLIEYTHSKKDFLQNYRPADVQPT